MNLKKVKYDYKNLSWNETFNLCFDKNSIDFDNMMKIINYAKSCNRGLKANSPNYNIHHIIPRSYYRKNNLVIDNSETNLVKLTLQEHFMVHYYAWKCSTKEIRRPMATAFHLMVGRVTSNLQNAPTLSLEQLSELMIPNIKNVDKKFRIEEKIHFLKTISKSKYITMTDEKHVKYKCIECGRIESSAYSKNKQYDLCKFCIKSKIHKGLILTDRIYPKEGYILCACVDSEFGSFWKLLSYKSYSCFASSSEINGFVNQCIELCDRVYIMKIFDKNKFSKDDLIKFFNDKFGYERSYTYFRNVFLREYAVCLDDNIYFKKNVDNKRWDNLLKYARNGKAEKFYKHHLYYLYSIYRKDRNVLKRLKKYLDKMVELNDGLDILDYKKEARKKKK